MLAEITLNGQSLSILATHPLPPINNTLFAARNRQLLAMSELLQSLPDTKLAIADLNTTLWSPFSRQFESQVGIKNARQGFGIQPTWPTQSPLLYIPLDHVVLSNDIAVVNSRTGQPIGSDRLPIIVDLLIPDSE